MAMRLRFKTRRIPAVTVLGMLALEAGIDPCAFWEMTADEVLAALRRRRLS